MKNARNTRWRRPLESLEERRLLAATLATEYPLVAPNAPSLVSTSFGDGVSGGSLTDTVQRSEVRDLALTFDRPVMFASGAVTLGVFAGSNASGPATDASAALGTPTTQDGGVTWIVPVLSNTADSDPTGSLRDGIYLATVHGASLTDSSGNSLNGGDQTLEFHRLFGDADGNGTINNVDYFQFRKTFGSVAGQASYNPIFDFDGNGAVNNADYFQFARRFGMSFSLLTRIAVGPSNLALADGTSFQFGATGYDQFGSVMPSQPAYAWSVLGGGSGGTINSAGLYTAPSSGTGTDTVQASADGISSAVTVTDTPSGIFTADSDIGSPVRAGHYSFDDVHYVVSGSGSDIWNAADQFNFASMKLTGDAIIVARVVGMQNTDSWAKAGIMFRGSLDPSAADAYVTMTPHNQVQFLDRAATGVSATDVGDATNVPSPIWVKLIREGNVFTAFWSPDGAAWNPLGGPVTVNMGATAYVGLVSSAHNNAAVNASVFDNVSVTPQPSTGVYRLAIRGQPNLSLDVQNFANADRTPVSLYYANHTSNQQWLVQGQGDGTFKIYAYSGQNSLQMLDDADGSIADGNPVTTFQDNNSSAQRWIFAPTSNGYWRIIPKNGMGTNQTLDVQNGSNAGIGSQTDIYTYGGGNNQQFQLADPGPLMILPSPKKGLAGNPGEIGNIHPSWIYTWGGTEPAGLPSNVEFVPMEWGYYGNANNGSVNWLNWVRSQPNIHTILGYNEPDNPGQSNLSVAAALDGWQYLSALRIPVGSPAAVHADDQWMRDFMAGAAQRGYRVDYVTIHWYGGDDPSGFINYVDYIHNLYNKPVWITEFAPADWSGQHGISAAQAADFMRQVIPQLNQRSYVQRYSWFSASTGDPNLGQAALFNNDGSLTDLGKLYVRM